MTLEQFNEAHMKVIYASIQEQVSRLPKLAALFGGRCETHRWYQCGEVYKHGNAHDEQICKRYAGHKGQHSQRQW